MPKAKITKWEERIMAAIDDLTAIAKKIADDVQTAITLIQTLSGGVPSAEVEAQVTALTSADTALNAAVAAATPAPTAPAT